MKKTKKMTVSDLYDYIISQMTAEDALKKLLASYCEQYKALRAIKGKEGSPYIIITMAAWELGWQIAIEKNHDQIRGIAIGTKEYLDERLK